MSELLLFRAAFETCASSIFIVDRATLKIVDCTHLAAERVGLTRDQMLNMSPLQLVT